MLQIDVRLSEFDIAKRHVAGLFAIENFRSHLPGQFAQFVLADADGGNAALLDHGRD